MASGCGNMGRSRVSRMISHRRNPHDSASGSLNCWEIGNPLDLGWTHFSKHHFLQIFFSTFLNQAMYFLTSVDPYAKATKRVRHLLRPLQILWEALSASSRSRGSRDLGEPRHGCVFFHANWTPRFLEKKHHNSNQFHVQHVHSTLNHQNLWVPAVCHPAIGHLPSDCPPWGLPSAMFRKYLQRCASVISCRRIWANLSWRMRRICRSGFCRLSWG